jgi:uncharacterized membrane protein YeiH
MSPQFELPFLLNYGATFVWAISGALVAARRGYDVAGIYILSLVTAMGGGLLRDGIFLQQGPPVLMTSPEYLLVIALATLLVVLFARHVKRIAHFDDFVAVVDALGIGAFAIVGMQKALSLELSVLSAVVVGVVNATGGGVLRDVLVRREPEIFKPGTLVAIAALLGCFLYIALLTLMPTQERLVAWITIVFVFTVRLLSVRLNVRTRSILDPEA